MARIVVSDFAAPYITAHVEDREEWLTGRGATAAEAIADLNEQIEEKENN